MNIIVCADTRMGISFNGKRPTRDKEIVRQILTTHGPDIYIRPTSEKYLQSVIDEFQLNTQLHIIENESDIWEDTIPIDAYIFVETGSEQFLTDLLDNADVVYLYQWNTTYMYTEQFPDIQKDKHFSVTSTEVLKGSSHDEVLYYIFERKSAEDEIPAEDDETDSLPFLNAEHQELYKQEMNRLSELQYEHTGRPLPPEMVAPMFLMTGMPFVYYRLKNYIPSEENPYPNYIDFTNMRENLRMSRGELLMLDLAENLFNSRTSVNIYNILAYCDRTMCTLAKRTLDIVFDKRVNSKI